MLQGFLRPRLAGALAAPRRFPGALACAWSAMAIALADPHGVLHLGTSRRALLSALLGIPLLLSLALLCERHRCRRPAALALHAGGAGLVVLWFLASGRWTGPGLWLRFGHLELALHLLVAFLPFAGAGAIYSFWRFNLALLGRLLEASALAGALMAFGAVGATGAIGASATPSALLVRLGATVILGLHPWMVLAGVPAVEATGGAGVPPGLAAWTRGALAPLSAACVLAADAGLLVALAGRRGPLPGPAVLVVLVVLAGTAALAFPLLTYPLALRREHGWVDRFGRLLLIGLLPPAAALLIGVALRLGRTGLTEPGCLLVLLSVWLVGVALFLLITRTRNIKLVPSSLCLLALLSCAGPWSPYGLARFDQRQRLRADLTAAGMLEPGARTARPPTTTLPAPRASRLRASLSHLLTWQGPGALAPELAVTVGQLDPELGPAADRAEARDQTRRVLRALGIVAARPSTSGSTSRDSGRPGTRGWDPSWTGSEARRRAAPSTPTGAAWYRRRTTFQRRMPPRGEGTSDNTIRRQR